MGLMRLIGGGGVVAALRDLHLQPPDVSPALKQRFAAARAALEDEA